MTDLKELLLPIKKRIITIYDLVSDEALAFNWFYQQQKKNNNHNILINNADVFDGLIRYTDNEGHWVDLVSEIEYESDAETFVEEMLMQCGLTITGTYYEEYTPLEELIDGYSLEKDIQELYIDAIERGYKTLFEAANDDLLKNTLSFFESRGIKYETDNDINYFIDDYLHTRITYYKLAGNDIENIFYFFASLNSNILHFETKESGYYIGIETPYESDGYYDFNTLDALYCLISQGYIEFDEKDLIDYDTIVESSMVNRFFNSIKIENTREVIF